ncbi:MAG: aminotransferase class V-fold PLP-dependent enzyme [Ignavibacteria bacterium]|nr:aminotransferase class V-fold PLP-dependent enzyme [Ignavibacteria bacterium]
MGINRRALINTLFTLGLFSGSKFFTHSKEKNLTLRLEDFEEKNTKTEEFWHWVRQTFTVSKNILNLNNGGVSPQPKPVQDAFIRYYQLSNEGPTYFMWRILDQGRETVRRYLAELGAVSPEEIAINRNTTEGINTIIFGLNLKPLDEVVLSKQDYPNVINAWKFRELRDKIKLVWVDLNLPSEDKNYLIDAYVSKFSPRTKVVNLTHMLNWNGQILPVQEIAKEAQKRNIYVLVDAAHTFAHIDFKITDLNCNFLATSLHKWLCAPFGTGMLYIKKEHIKEIPPLHPTEKPYSEDIRKFESLGTRSFPAEIAISEAINFHQIIGIKRKENRLYELKQYWTNELMKLENCKILTPLSKEFSCGLGLFSIEGKKPEEISDFLFNKYKIFVTPINWESISGIRITPNIYTLKSDLDFFITAIKEFVKK